MAVLIFDKAITRVYVGSQDYGAELKHNYLLIKSRQPQVPPASLFVIYDQGQRFFHGLLQASTTPPQTYDLRGAPPLEPAGMQPPPSSALLQGIHTIQALPQAYYDRGMRKNKLIAVLLNVLHDDAYTYLKVLLANDSSIDFHIEQVSFAYKDRAQLALTPALLPDVHRVPAHAQRTLVYVLPLYGTQEKGALLINWREENGERALALTLPASLLLNAPYLDEEQ